MHGEIFWVKIAQNSWEKNTVMYAEKLNGYYQLVNKSVSGTATRSSINPVSIIK